jgi:hypothetical protein
MGFGHAINKTYCSLGVSRDDRLLDIWIWLGWPCAARLLSATGSGELVPMCGADALELACHPYRLRLPNCRMRTMISKWIAFLVTALMLANCCALGNGCAPAAVSPVAWDGLGSPPTEETQPLELRPKQHARAKSIRAVGAARSEPSNKAPQDQWAQQQAVDQEEEVRLKRKLMICRSCMTPESATDATGSTR